MLTFIATANTTESVKQDIKVVSRYIKKYGSKFSEHLDISKKDANAILKALDDAYHAKNKEIVPDEVYDIFRDWMNAEYPETKKKIGAKVKKVKGAKVVEVRLEVPMASQDKLKPGDDFDKFLDANAYVIGDKLDGISLELVYFEGVPVKAYTRGDGIMGQDVSGVIPALNIPKHINSKERFIVRAEFISKRKTFNDKHSKHHGNGEFATARNMGGGLLKRNVPSSEVADFDAITYEILRGKNAGKNLSTQFRYLKRLGFDVVRHKLVSKLSEAELIALHTRFKKTAKHDIDGIIVTKDVSYTVSAKNPKHSKAFKVNSLEDSREVVVKEVIWGDSRHNRSIPRVTFDPIVLGGVEVTFATGHNYFYIQNGFTKKEGTAARKKGIKLPVRPIGVGAVVRVIRSGDVIPYIMEVIKPARKAAQPAGKFETTEDGVHAILTKTSTRTKQKRIQHFFKALDADGLKEGTIAKLYDSGYNTVRKILRLKVDDVLALEGFQKTSANALIKNIKACLANATFANLGYASHLFGDKVGSSKLQSVIDEVPNIMRLAEKGNVRVLEEKIREVHGIKDTATIIAQKLPEFVEYVNKLGITLVRETKQQIVSAKLEGVRVTLTGVRDPELVKAIIANGGAEAGTVKTATHVITKPGYNNNKTEQAESAGIPIMTIDEFKKKFKL